MGPSPPTLHPPTPRCCAVRPSIEAEATPLVVKPRPATTGAIIHEAASKTSVDSAAGVGVTGGATTSLAAKMKEYDPEAAKAAEHDALLREVTSRREQSSALHHHVMRLLAQREDLEHEREKMLYEDNVERERDEGRRAVVEVRGEARRAGAPAPCARARSTPPATRPPPLPRHHHACRPRRKWPT